MHFIASFIASLFHHTQAQYLVFTFKAVIILSLVSAITFVAQYTYYAPWWRDHIGQRIVYETIGIVLLLIPSALSLFFHLNRLTSEVVAWYDCSMLGVVAGIIIWGIVVWKNERDYVQSSVRGQDGNSDQEKDNSYQAQEQGQVHSDSKEGREICTS